MNPRSIMMIEHVADKAKTGHGVPAPPGEWRIDPSVVRELRSAGRYLNRNKRKIAINVASVVAAGLMTGGVAPVIAIAGKAAQFATLRTYRKFDHWRKENTIKSLFPDVLNPDGSFRSKRGDWLVGSDGMPIPGLWDELPPLMTSLVGHRDFSAMINAIEDLVRAGREFYAIYQKHHSKGFDNCGDCIDALEKTYLFAYHYHRLRSAFNFFEQYTTYIVLEYSRIDAESDQWYPKFLDKLMRRDQGFVKNDFRKGWNTLNEAANHSAVLHTRGNEILGRKEIFGIRISREHDYRAWVRNVLTPWINLYSPHVYANGASDVSGEATLGDKALKAREKVIPALGGQVVKQGLGTPMASHEVKGATSWFVENPNASTLGGTAGSLGAAGAEVVAGIMAEAANSKWNQYQLKSEKEALSRLSLLKAELKPTLERFCTKFSHYQASHSVFTTYMQGYAGNYSEQGDLNMAIHALRPRKHRTQSIESDAFRFYSEFYELYVRTANDEYGEVLGKPHLEETTREGRNFVYREGEPASVMSRSDLLEMKIDEFLEQHDTPCSGYCYGNRDMLGQGHVNLHRVRDELPLKPIGAAKTERVEL